MQPKAGIDCASAGIVTLAGVEWFVPLLAMRQNRVVVPRMLKVLPLIDAARDLDSDAYIDVFNEETLDMFTHIVHAALTRAYDLTLDAFLDLPITPREMMAAMPVIVKATGFFRENPEGVKTGDPPSGEAVATS